MDKRFFIALAASIVLMILVQRIFPTPAAKRATAQQTAQAQQAQQAQQQAQPGPQAQPGAQQLTTTAMPGAPAGAAAAAETVTVATPLVRYRFSTVGAAPVGATLTAHRSLRRGVRGERGPVELARSGVPLLRFAVRAPAAGGAAAVELPLDRMPFAVDSTAGTGAGTAPLTFRAPVGPSAEAVISYTFDQGKVGGYLAHVTGQVTGMPGAQLVITLPAGLRSEEADSLDDARHLAYAVKPTRDDAHATPFAKVDTLRATVAERAPFTWVASKNKYFLVGLLADTVPGTASQPFSSVRVTRARGPAGVKKPLATTADATVTQPLTAGGRFAFDLYAGPQEWRRLRVLGRDFEHVNPYGGLLQGVVQPFATIIMRVLLWMHDNLKISYGWVLVIFGVAIRIILWPLQQSSMRTNLKMQGMQPEMQAIQKKYASDPTKQQQAMMEIYKKHGLSPLSPLAGCMPMLLPMPVLFALFYVFGNTIEFRGVPFLWLPDIALKDPYYILPLLMGASMFLLSWIGLRNSPPNPQAKMMSYTMPAVMTFVFFNFASGLNLYYTVQNLVSLPQQWLLARERAKNPAPVPAAPPPASTTTPTPRPRRAEG